MSGHPVDPNGGLQSPDFLTDPLPSKILDPPLVIPVHLDDIKENKASIVLLNVRNNQATEQD